MAGFGLEGYSLQRQRRGGYGRNAGVRAGDPWAAGGYAGRSDIKELYSGMNEICREFGAQIIGGDMVRSPVGFITVALTWALPPANPWFAPRLAPVTWLVSQDMWAVRPEDCERCWKERRRSARTQIN